MKIVPMEHSSGYKFVNLSKNSPTTHLSDRLNHDTLGKSRDDFTHDSSPKASPTDFLEFLPFIEKRFQQSGK